MPYNHKTIENISVTWSDEHDAEMRAIVGDDAVYVTDWIMPTNPPQGSPKTGFNIRSQSMWKSGVIYIDFDNVPYFWRHDCNPKAILWKDQLPVILEALRKSGFDMDSQCIPDLMNYPTKPREIPISPSKLTEFIRNLNQMI